jgi:hypothetical protein
MLRPAVFTLRFINVKREAEVVGSTASRPRSTSITACNVMVGRLRGETDPKKKGREEVEIVRRRSGRQGVSVGDADESCISTIVYHVRWEARDPTHPQ